jgi:tetratricopeptide (TPR) repeat protein
MPFLTLRGVIPVWPDAGSPHRAAADTVPGLLLVCSAVRFLAVVLALNWAGQAVAADSVRLWNGDELIGSIFSLAPEAIEIETEAGAQKLSVVDYREITFDGEPDELAEARRHLEAGRPQAARDALAAIAAQEIADVDRRIQEEHAYLVRLAAARTAPPAESPAAVATLAAFLQSNPRSHHTYSGRESIGDILAEQGRFEEAAAAYRELDRGPPALRVRSAAAQGRLLAKAGKPAEAIRKFEAAAGIVTDASDVASTAEKQESALGLARCLATVGKPAEAIAAVRSLIDAADPEAESLLAAAFTTLGVCQRAGGMNDDALISFLTVDLVYHRQPGARAESLFNLVQLWETSNNPERARAARDTLIGSFPDSPWAKKLVPPDG